MLLGVGRRWDDGFFCQAEDGIRVLVRSRGLEDVYKRQVQDWAKYLGEDQDREAADSVIKATKIGRPCGNEDFVKRMEGLLNRQLTASPRGRPRKKGEK